eukprot:TRINITY_DN2952_c0_g1_i4.p2 TRINITY_DN2952_c0_g1~~TRINITY_DN2952_c0_g1_i4.p2  ORF type:complete len:201 (+),score=-18.35 TRINITY_DN2952_c0_g1_i4:162-764(+)
MYTGHCLRQFRFLFKKYILIQVRKIYLQGTNLRLIQLHHLLILGNFSYCVSIHKIYISKITKFIHAPTFNIHTIFQLLKQLFLQIVLVAIFLQFSTIFHLLIKPCSSNFWQLIQEKGKHFQHVGSINQQQRRPGLPSELSLVLLPNKLRDNYLKNFYISIGRFDVTNRINVDKNKMTAIYDCNGLYLDYQQYLKTGTETC